MKKVKIAYICSPYAGDTERNIAYARELTLDAILEDLTPITPHLYIPQVLPETDEGARRMGLGHAMKLLTKCDLLIVGKRYGISSGMKAEITTAKALGIDIREVE